MKQDIGIIGLAVMGENLALNIESKGYSVSVFDIDTQKTQSFLDSCGKDKHFIGVYSIESLVKSLKTPRKVMMMVRAGQPVDELIEQLACCLESGDVIIDGGNSHFTDTFRRTNYVEEKGLYYIGTGVSGGAEGARKGPSLMPGGSFNAWPLVQPIFNAICAKAPDGKPCCEWVGPGGAGHYVKMVHNGIEYGDMQLIGEAYHLMKTLLNMSADDMCDIFAAWNRGELSSYLIGITSDILGVKDEDGVPLIDKICDTAGQKGTGKWTAAASLNEGTVLTLISEAVYARFLSAKKQERMLAAKRLNGPVPRFDGDKAAFVNDIKNALYASKIISYAQGFSLLSAAAKTYGWKLDYGKIALMWRGGCIIRSAFLDKIKHAFDNNPELANLLLDPFFQQTIESCQQSLRTVLSAAVLNGIPVPALAAALSYYDGYRCESLPANLLQAQRDYFGAHMYERIDAPQGRFFHTDWTGKGGATAASTYTV